MQGICRSGVLIALFSALLGPTAAIAQQSAGPEDGKQVIIETYAPSFEDGRLALARRVRRVTKVTNDGSQTVEEIEEPNPASPSEPVRVIRRSVTTVRRTGAGSYVSERQLFELDVNGRFIPVLVETERTSRN